MKQGGTIKRIKQCVPKIYGKNFEIFKSFSSTRFKLCVVRFVQ